MLLMTFSGERKNVPNTAFIDRPAWPKKDSHAANWPVGPIPQIVKSTAEATVFVKALDGCDSPKPILGFPRQSLRTSAESRDRQIRLVVKLRIRWIAAAAHSTWCSYIRHPHTLTITAIVAFFTSTVFAQKPYARIQITTNDVDQNRIAIWGGSQGGGFAFATAALDSRVDMCVADIPFLCDWHNYFKLTKWPEMNEWIE